MFVYALNQWCKVFDTLEGQGYCVTLEDDCISFVLFEEIGAICQA